MYCPFMFTWFLVQNKTLREYVYMELNSSCYVGDKGVWLCVFLSAACKAMLGLNMWRNIVLCLVSAQVNAFPSIWPSLREYSGALTVTWYHWLMLIAPHRAPLSPLQQAKANPAAIIILKIIPQKWSHHWIIQPSSLVRTLSDLWHHLNWISFSRCVRAKKYSSRSHIPRTVECF